MKFGTQTSVTISEHIQSTTPIFLPLGAIEAHGAHLPLETDNILVEKYTKLICDKTGGLILPLIPYGQVWSLKDFPGSITISNDTLINLIFEIGESLYLQGMKVFVLVSGHLGNMEAMKNAARKLVAKYTDIHTLYLFYPNIQKLASNVREGEKSHDKYIHACEIETSLMLYLAPEYVEMDKAIVGKPNIKQLADYTPTPWSEFTDTAVLGDATLASAEKGEYLINTTLDTCVALITELMENYSEVLK